MTIERDIPLPTKRTAYITSFGAPLDVLKTFHDLKPNDSFVVDTNAMRVHVLKRSHDKKIRLTSEKEDGRYRIWRKE